MDQLFESPQTPRHSDVPIDEEPLAARMRPRTLEEFVGQEQVLAPGSALRTAIEQGTPHSMILYGPPGSGKTTLARIVAHYAGAAFEEESAVNAGRAEVRAVMERARERRRATDGQGTILFLDEIHRFNKAQQDTLLPAVEEGLLTLIGATTENPYFEVNSALLSRARIYELQTIPDKQIGGLLRRALSDARGIDDPPEIEEGAIDFIATRAGGDARTAYNALELAVEVATRFDQTVTVELAEDSLQQRAVLYDKGGDKHYDFISAWIKATRGSDVDASLYYLAVMLEGGEDPRFIARRMIILASEDIGNADPQALVVAVAAAQAVEHVGLPEAALNLSQAAVYLSLAPKSNASYKAISKARGYVREHGVADPPDYLRDAHYPGAKQLGRGAGYEYPHDLPGGVSEQPLLPEEVRGQRFYEPTDRGFERELRSRLDPAQAARDTRAD